MLCLPLFDMAQSNHHASVRFVPQLRAGTSQVEKELELSNQRSHAARAVHARKKRPWLESGWRPTYHNWSSYSVSNGPGSTPADAQLGFKLKPWRAINVTTKGSKENDRVATEGRHEHIANSSAVRCKPNLPWILQCGNSDPFDTMSLPITPTINQLIQFIRDAYVSPFKTPKLLCSNPVIDYMHLLSRYALRCWVGFHRVMWLSSSDLVVVTRRLRHVLEPWVSREPVFDTSHYR
jgi:hypothetical protein